MAESVNLLGPIYNAQNYKFNFLCAQASLLRPLLGLMLHFLLIPDSVFQEHACLFVQATNAKIYFALEV